MDLTTITLDQFMCTDDHVCTGDAPETFEIIRDMWKDKLKVTVRNFNEEYSISRIMDHPENTIILNNGDIVGLYIDDVLEIDPSHRGRGLSVPLILEAVKHRPLPAKRIVSVAGKKALQKSWRVANGKDKDPWPNEQTTESQDK